MVLGLCIVPIHDLDPLVLKMAHRRSIRDLNPNMDISRSDLTERTLSTLAIDELGRAREKSRFSITNDDDDDATFDAEFNDFCDKHGIWRKSLSLDLMEAECALLCSTLRASMALS